MARQCAKQRVLIEHRIARGQPAFGSLTRPSTNNARKRNLSNLRDRATTEHLSETLRS